MSSIFERLARLARAEFNHIKSVMSDRDDERLWDSALRRAFEEERDAGGESVLERLEARGDETVRVLLREAIDEAEAAVV